MADICAICLEFVPPKIRDIKHLLCCGKTMHIECTHAFENSPLSREQKNKCPMCRQKIPTSHEEIVEYLRKHVGNGKAWAQYLLGLSFRTGLGITQCFTQAAEHFKMAAKQGLADAQYNLGILHSNGDGVYQSYKQAAEYYEMAAKQGFVDAQYNLGILYYNGDGVEQSFEKAKKWWIMAAMEGDEESIKQLQELDNIEGRTTPSFVPIRCSACNTLRTSSHKLRNCPCGCDQSVTQHVKGRIGKPINIK